LRRYNPADWKTLNCPWVEAWIVLAQAEEQPAPFGDQAFMESLGAVAVVLGFEISLSQAGEARVDAIMGVAGQQSGVMRLEVVVVLSEHQQRVERIGCLEPDPEAG
jgi:hypothetical protein